MCEGMVVVCLVEPSHIFVEGLRKIHVNYGSL